MCGSEEAVMTTYSNGSMKGPPLAKVSGVEVTEDEWQEFKGFSTG